MPSHKETESTRPAGATPAGEPAFYPQRDFPRGYVAGDLVRYNAETGLWERISEEDFKEALDIEEGSHVQGTDQGLDTGGPNAVTAAAVKAAVDNSHAPGSDDQDLSGLVTKIATSPDPTGYLPEYDETGNLVKSAKTAASVHAAVTVSAPISLSGQALSLINNAVTPGTITAIDIDGTLAANSDLYLPTQKAVKSAIATHAALITGVHGLVFTADKSLTLTESLTLNALPIGGLAVATAANTLGSLAVGTVGQYLAGAGAGTVPAWATLNQAAVAGLTTGDSPTFAGATLNGSTQLVEKLRLSGQEYNTEGVTSTDGIAFILSLNRSGLRGLWIADSAAMAKSSANPLLEFYPTYGFINAIAADGATWKPLTFTASQVEVSLQSGEFLVKNVVDARFVVKSTSANHAAFRFISNSVDFASIDCMDAAWSVAKNMIINPNGGCVGIGGTTNPLATLSVSGGVHVGGVSDPGDNNLLVDGTAVITGAFGCNSKTAQTAYASGGALSAYSAGLCGFDSDAHAQEIHTLLGNIRAALVANGIMS